MSPYMYVYHGGTVETSGRPADQIIWKTRIFMFTWYQLLWTWNHTEM